MPVRATLIIAYHKELIRAGLQAMLAGSTIKIIGETENTSCTLTLTQKHKPAVVRLAAAIPGGDAFELVRELPPPCQLPS